MDLSKLGDPDIKIAALKIWVHGRQFEDAQDYWDGNWLRVTAHCGADGGSALAHGSILHLGELANFVGECSKLHEAIEGWAELSCMEPNLGVKLSATDSRGTIEAEIQLTPDQLTQEHSFLFVIDQSYLPSIITGLRRVLAQFPLRGDPNSGAA